MDQETKFQFQTLYQKTLLDDIVPFWLKNGLDDKVGGIFTCLDQDGSLLDSDKGIWQQGRFAWLMAKLYNNVQRNADWLNAAQSTCQFLMKNGFDPKDGRMWFHVTADGVPIRKRRYAFAESFAAIAFGELYKATGNEDYKQIAFKTFQTFVNHEVTKTEFGPKFTANRPSRGLGVPMITIVTAQELRDSIGLIDANHFIDQAIDDIQNYHVKEDLQCVMETVGNDGQIIDHFDGWTLNPGHAIEGAWFILREASFRQDQQLLELGCKMLDWMWDLGWDKKHGGLLYFVGLNGKPVQEYWHDMKFWWPQNELIIASLYAYQLTGQEKYEEMFYGAHQWAFEHFPDPKHGEWFGYLRRDGSVNSPVKGNLWKGPFHLPRMLLIGSQLLRSESTSPFV